MTLAHELTLDSQVDLLERLQLLTRYGSNLVNVVGEKGAGKSWLAQRYLEHWASDKNQSLLMCHAHQEEAQRRQIVLSQLTNEGSWDDNESLFTSFNALFENRHCDIVVVVDDAHLLSDELITEFWLWILEAQDNPKWSINVVFFSQPSGIDALLVRLSYGQKVKPVSLEIELLSVTEADHLFEQRVLRYLDISLERQATQAYKKTALLPGEIMALAELKSEKRIIIRFIIGSPWRIALLVLLLLLLALGGYFWLNNQPSPTEVMSSLPKVIEPSALDDGAKSESNSEPAHEENQLNEVLKSTSTGKTSPLSITDDSDALPPSVKESQEAVGDDVDGQQRLVISSDVVDALLNQKTEEETTILAKEELSSDMGVELNNPVKEKHDVKLTPEQQAELDDIAAFVSAPESELTTAKEQNEHKIAVVVKETAKETTPPKETSAVQATLNYDIADDFTFQQGALMAMSPLSYTIQLAAMHSLTELHEFIRQHQLTHQVNVYPTKRAHVQWYIVTYRNYPTIQQARDAIATLPKEWQTLGAWAKSLRQVQNEIEQN